MSKYETYSEEKWWKDTTSGKTRFTCEERTVELKTNKEGKIVVAKVL